MALSLPFHHSGHVHRELSPAGALRKAWYCYLTMLFVPFVLSLGVITYLNYHAGTAQHRELNNFWFLGSIAFMLVTGPVAFAVRSRYFRSYWRGVGVEPHAYLTGMLIVWATFELGGIISLIGCIASEALLPCLFPALAAFMFFTPLWPSGSAMAKPTGADDPEMYQEPR